MQATVRSFDHTTRSGTVLRDDGTELPHGASAFDAGGCGCCASASGGGSTSTPPG